MTVTMLAGFAAIGGILAGYVMARVGPRMGLWILWAACLILFIGFYVWVRYWDTSGGLDAVVILIVILAPFVGCVFVAGAVGLVVRRISDKKEQRE